MCDSWLDPESKMRRYTERQDTWGNLETNCLLDNNRVINFKFPECDNLHIGDYSWFQEIHAKVLRDEAH